MSTELVLWKKFAYNINTNLNIVKMLMIKTKVKESNIQDAGLGLFADEFIKEGTVTWRFCPGFDQILYEDDLLRLSEASRLQFLKYTYKSLEEGYYVCCGDDDRFINHCEKPNIIEGETEENSEPFSIAARDIYPGEELLCNYFDYDANALMKLNNDFEYKPKKDSVIFIYTFEKIKQLPPIQYISKFLFKNKS